MDASKYSSKLPAYSGDIKNELLKNTLSVLNISSGQILVWNENNIAIPIDLAIELPPLGNFEGIDIRPIESIILVLNLAQYPTVPPKVYPNRIDFPRSNLAHLYVPIDDKPGAFCLARGGLKEWYANKTINDLIIRVKNWLRDAATGELVNNGNQFDPLRLEGHSGTIVYDYDLLAKLVIENKGFASGINFSLAYFERTYVRHLTYTLQTILSSENLKQIHEGYLKEVEKDQSLVSTKKYNFGYVVWSQDVDAFADYDVKLPQDWNSFVAFCSRFKISLSSLEKFIAELDPNKTVEIPIVVAIKRPKPLIGYTSDIEFINFYLRVDSPDVSGGKIINNIPVKFLSHNQHLSVKKAQEISGLSQLPGGINLIFGCGALGSKVVMHLARNGIVNYFLFDQDSISYHNLVRHSLTANSVGMNKAAALEQTIKQIFPNEKLPTLNANKIENEFLENGIINQCSWIFDFTASNAFAHKIINQKNITAPVICKGYITDHGGMGILLIEGKDRNSRIDDLKVFLYSKYKERDDIAGWLQRENAESQSGSIEVNVGLGCNSETIILSDEVISTHAAYFTSVIKSEISKSSEDGRIYVCKISSDVPSIETLRFTVLPMVVLNPLNDNSWEIRIMPGILENLKKEMGLAMPYETGGVFVGSANFKTKTIHIVDVILAPPDSKSNQVCFFRGIEGLSDQIALVNEKSGGQFGYIGEWHTHPFGPEEMSNTDFQTIKKFKKQFSDLPSPLPVLLLIVTPTTIITYVY